MVRPGECVDLYYYDGETSKKQCFPTTQNTKFVQQFQNLNGGSSVFTIPPNMGIQDIVLEMVIAGQAAQTGISLPRGWGYALIKQVSFRYGGSSQYFLSGSQILQNALRRQTSRSSADDILTLAGNFASSGTTPDLSVDQYATVVLTLPHNIPSGVGKAHPLPTDLLTQQVQITVELLPVASLYTVNPGGGSSAPPTALKAAQFVVQQVVMNNQGDALARRVDMSTNAYAFPCEFVQQEQVIPLANTSAAQEVVLTGFRSGEVKAIHCWITRDEDLTNGGAVNPFLWYAPQSIQMTYAGDVYARYENYSVPLWNLINGNKSPAVDNIVVAAAAPPTAAPYLSQWNELPFAQTHVDEDSHYTLVHGKPITNGIVNLNLAFNPAAAVNPQAGDHWRLHVSYIYNTTLLFSQGTADYVF
jgi:hypothetical protein